MIEASLVDLLRISTIPLFAAAAIADHRSRFVPRLLWLPIVGLGVLAASLDDIVSFGPLLVVAVALLLDLLGLLGRADTYAILAIGVVFPTLPTLSIAGVSLPLETAPHGVGSLSILLNAAVLSLAYPGVDLVRNLLERRGPSTARSVAVCELEESHGVLVESGLDLDDLRSFVSWRDESVISRAPAREEAAEFCESDRARYGATPDRILEAAESIRTSSRVWVEPGIPYIVPLFLGILAAISIGDLVFYLLPI